MKQLIMKDIRVVGYINVIILLVAIVSGYIGASLDIPFKSNATYLYGITLSVYFAIVMIITKEYKYKANALIVSMPVKKFDVVKARYLFMVVYLISISLMIYLSSNISKIIFRDVRGIPLELNIILIIVSLNIIYLVFNLPFQYYNIGRAQMFNTIFYMIIILAPNILSRYDINIMDNNIVKKLLSLNLNQISITVFGISILMYLISLFVSKSIYEAKEF